MEGGEGACWIRWTPWSDVMVDMPLCEVEGVGGVRGFALAN